MPLEEIQSVLATPDLQARNARITAHLDRLEGELGRVQRAVGSLRDILAPHPPDAAAAIQLRSVPATPAAAVSAVVDSDDIGSWFQGALGELHATLTAQRLPATGTAGGIFADDLFTHHRGQATIFIPCADSVRPVGRVTATVIPAVELAVITHGGTPTESDRSYGELATYVTRHAIAVDGPIREYYLVGQRDTADIAQWRTEIGWPIFQTRATTGPDEADRGDGAQPR